MTIIITTNDILYNNDHNYKLRITIIIKITNDTTVTTTPTIYYYI